MSAIPRPDLVVKKEAYARVRQLVSLEEKFVLLSSFRPLKVNLEEEASMTSGTAASLVQEAVGQRQPPNDALKQVGGYSLNEWSLCII